MRVDNPTITGTATGTIASASFSQTATTSSYSLTANVLTNTTSSINWTWNLGTPTAYGATFAGVAYYFTGNPSEGILLTNATNAESGYAYWTHPTTNYFTSNTNSWKITANIKANGGTGEDGIYIFGGSSSGTNAQQGLYVYADEYNADALKVGYNGTQIDLFYTYQGAFDNNIFRELTLVCDQVGTNKVVYVAINGLVFYQRNIGNITFPGNICGVAGVTGGANNYHFVNRFQVTPAKAWLINNGYL
jgi:hypothetical protein